MNGSLAVLTLAVLVGLCASSKADAAAEPPKEKPRGGKPRVKKLGTIDCDMVETTPVVFGGRLCRFEYVRGNYWNNQLRKPHFRFIDVASGQPTPAFALGFHLGSAFVDGDTVYVYGVKGWDTPDVYVFWSKDLKAWKSQVAFKTPGWGLFNTSVCKGDGRYVMAFEVGRPPEVVGAPSPCASPSRRTRETGPSCPNPRSTPRSATPPAPPSNSSTATST